MNEIQSARKVKNKILNKIKKGEVEKKSAFYFIAQNYFFWLMFVISVIVGAIAFSSFIIHFILESGPWYKFLLGKNNLFYIIKAFPLLWLIVILIFIITAWFNFKNTKKAYKKHNFLIVSFSVIFSLILGLILLFTGIGKNIDNSMKHHFSSYQKYSQERFKDKKNFLESDCGLDSDEFMKNHKIKHCQMQGCKHRMK